MTAPDGDDRPYVPVRIAPDPARDARVAARRAADARKAGRALDALLGLSSERMTQAYYMGWNDGHAAQGLQHNRAYGVVPDDVAVHVPHRHGEAPDDPCHRVQCHAQGGLLCTFCGGQPCRVYTINPHYGVAEVRSGVDHTGHDHAATDGAVRACEHGFTPSACPRFCDDAR